MEKTKPKHVRFLNFFGDLYRSVRFSYHYIRRRLKYGRFEYPYIDNPGNDSIRVLGTGPSLSNELSDMRERGELNDYPLFAMNFFANSELFFELKPTRYCLADPAFFKDVYMIERVHALFDKLNTHVSWNMRVYVPNVSIKEAEKRITNPKLTIIPISTLHFEGFESKRYSFYKKGKATPSFVNVLIMIEYICLNEGFKKIFLYGADHTFLNNLMVDDDNILKVEDTHFYGTERIIANVHEDGTPWRIAEFIYDKYLTFKEHDVARGYADYLGAEIINCTRKSMIDSYIRIAQIDNKKISK